MLQDISLENTNGSKYKSNFSNKRTPEKMREDKQKSFDAAFEMLTTFQDKTETTVREMAQYLDVTEKTVRTRATENGKYYITNSIIGMRNI